MIDHAMEEDDDDDDNSDGESNTELLTEIDETEEDNDDDDDITDKVEILSEKLDGAKPFATIQSASTNGHVLTSDQYFMAQSSKSKVSKQSFSSILESFDLYEADVAEITTKELALLRREFKLANICEKEMRKYYHLLK